MEYGVYLLEWAVEEHCIMCSRMGSRMGRNYKSMCFHHAVLVSPRRACAARVALRVSLSVCLSVCVSRSSVGFREQQMASATLS